MSSRSGCRARSRRSARCTMPSSAKFSRADLVLGRRQAEEEHRRDAERPDAVHFAVERLVHGEVVDAGHRGDLALDPGTVDHEERLDEVGGGELVLAHEPPQGLGAPPAPGAMDLGGGHGGKTRERKGIAATGRLRTEAPGMALAASSSWWPGSRPCYSLLYHRFDRSRPFASCITASGSSRRRQVGARLLEARWSRLPMRTFALPAFAGAGRPGGRRLWRAPRQARSTSTRQSRDRHRRRHPLGRHRPRARSPTRSPSCAATESSAPAPPASARCPRAPGSSTRRGSISSPA